MLAARIEGVPVDAEVQTEPVEDPEIIAAAEAIRGPMELMAEAQTQLSLLNEK